VTRTARGVDPADYTRDCELASFEDKPPPADREDTREPFRADLAGEGSPA
jgi:hypothetical protein